MSNAHVLIDQLEVALEPWLNGPRRSVDRNLKPHIAKALGISPDKVMNYTIDRRSLDARHKPDLRFIYRLKAEIDPRAGVRESKTIQVLTEDHDQANDLFHLPLQRDLPQQPVIVGTARLASWRPTCWRCMAVNRWCSIAALRSNNVARTLNNFMSIANSIQQVITSSVKAALEPILMGNYTPALKTGGCVFYWMPLSKPGPG